MQYPLFMALLENHAAVTSRLLKNPHNPLSFLQRAEVYRDLQYPELAAADAYLAILLLDEVDDSSSEHYHEVRTSLCSHVPDYSDAVEEGKRKAFGLLATCLSRCGCFESALLFCKRGLRKFPEDEVLKSGEEKIVHAWRLWTDNADQDNSRISDMSLVRREVYPWNDHEPDRFSASNLAVLNAQMAGVAPHLEVRATELPDLTSGRGSTKQLGIFAKQAIAPGEEILRERSLLTANNRIKEPLCDACSSPLLEDLTDSKVQTCDDCDDVFFCDSTCYDLAMEKYHGTLCGRDIDELGKDAQGKDINNALYFLLLQRAIALADTQQLHPLELSDVKYIWGDFRTSPSPPSINIDNFFSAPKPSPPFLPFSWKYDITLPLHALEQLELPILPNHDPWVLLTLLSKFRGTASARVSLGDGKPEVAAVHPMWSLANHSCAPNVHWVWGGMVRFWCLDERMCDDGEQIRGGIAKDAEIWNHYCDIELSYKDRREWMSGPLGGECRCKRCRREESADEQHAQATN